MVTDKAIFVIEGFGEYGLDVDHSPGVGGYYVKLYDGSFDCSGYESEKEAREDLEGLVEFYSEE
jgi:hypothetical protein